MEKNCKRWTEEEEKFLIENFEKESYITISKFLNRKPRNISAKACRLGLRKIKNKYVNIERGQRFSRLISIKAGKIVESRKVTKRYWFFKCDCGNEKELDIRIVMAGYVISCGCAKRNRNPSPWLKKPGEVSFNDRYRAYKSSAEQRDIEFKLTIGQYISIVTQECFYSGDVPQPYNTYLTKDGSLRKLKTYKEISEETIERAWINTNGIDRIDSSKGYTLDNCVPCCKKCNIMKLDSSKDDFIAQAYKIVAHQEKQKIKK